MIINPRFQYPTLNRTTAEDGTRFYLDPNTNEALPSVTTILSHTKDKTFLIEWEKRVGSKKAEEIRNEATGLGTLLHTHMECHIQGIPRPKGSNLVRQMAERMANVIIREAIPKVDEVWGYEIPLYFPTLYAGTTDLVGVYDGKPAIMDYKNTKKMKSKDMLEDYFCQCSAYALAHNLHYDTDIQTLVILMVDRQLEFKEFLITGDEFHHYASRWQSRLLEYEATGGPRAIAAGSKVEQFVAAPGG